MKTVDVVNRSITCPTCSKFILLPNVGTPADELDHIRVQCACNEIIQLVIFGENDG